MPGTFLDIWNKIVNKSKILVLIEFTVQLVETNK